MTLLALVFFFFNTGVQEFSLDSCYHYWAVLENDAKLFAYLQKTDTTNLSTRDRLSHNYYLARYYRSTENRKKAAKIIYKEIMNFESRRHNDTMHFKYLDELVLLYNRGDFEDREKGLTYAQESINEKWRLKANKDEFGKSYYCKALLFVKSKTHKDYLDSTIFYFIKARDFYADEVERNRLLNSICLLKIENNDLEGVEKDINQIIRFEQIRVKNTFYPHMTRFQYLLKSQKYEQAKNTLDSLFKVVRVTKIQEDKKDVIQGYLQLTHFTKDVLAYSAWQDSLAMLIELSEQPPISEMIDNARLSVEVERYQDKESRNELWMIILSLLSVILGISWYARSKYAKQRHKATVADFEKSKIEAELKAVRAEMKGEQKERNEIASQLHDNLASLLTAADLHLSVAQRTEQDSTSLNKAKDILKDVNQQVRSLSHQLVSPSLMKFGLEPALETFLNGYQTEDLKINFSSNLGERRLEESKEVFIYRSVAELLQNVQKHGHADQVEVNLSQSEDVLSVQVSDNGQMTSDNIDFGFGLTNIQKRAQALGGDLKTIVSPDGFKAKITIKA